MKKYFYFFLFCLISCKKSTYYEVQYWNKTGLILSEIHTSIDDDLNSFLLEKGDSSSVFRMENTIKPIVGPPFLHHTVKKYKVQDTTFSYTYANLIDLQELYEDKVNLIEIILDTSQFNKKSFFRFNLIK